MRKSISVKHNSKRKKNHIISIDVEKANWRRQWQPTPVLLPGKSHGQRGLVGCSPWGCYKSDTIEGLHFDFSLSCIGEGNGNPLQCSCLENPRDGGAWWAAVNGVTQSRTQLKRLSSIELKHEIYKAFKLYLGDIPVWRTLYFDILENQIKVV